MNKNYFNASSWLQKENIIPGETTNKNDSSPTGPVSAPFTPFTHRILNKDLFSFENKLKKKDFDPTLFLTPGFEDNLLSRDGSGLKKGLEVLQRDVMEHFSLFPNFNKSLKTAIYNEFLSYADSKALNCNDLDNYLSFWKHLQLPYTKYKKELDEFVETYCFRMAVVYLFKIRFMAILAQETNINLADKDLLNPNSFLGQLFKKSSSTELRSEALQSNHYTWYRPSPSKASLLNKLTGTLKKITISELIAIIAVPKDQKGPTEEEDGPFSHSLSHRNFGHYLRLLISGFPEWISDRQGETGPYHYYLKSSQKGPEILTAKYAGNHVESRALSHWLSLDLQQRDSTSPIICPDFQGDDTNFSHFMKICYDLQFLTSLIYLGKATGKSLIPFISMVTQKKNEAVARDEESQINLFQDFSCESIPKYDRIILKLTKFPKNNPHFYLIHQIQSHIRNLKKNGLITVFSTKKLFVPSQSEKVEQLLKVLKLEGTFTYDGLKGKGEIPAYTYIFSRKDDHPLFSGDFLGESGAQMGGQKESCLSFRISGELSSFNKFSIVVEGIKKFFASKKAESTPLFQTEWEEGLTFEFYQDAIVDGKLIHSSTQDSSKITHPAFFKNLMKSCLPLDHFFHIEHIDMDSAGRDFFSAEKLSSGPLLEIKFPNEEKFSFVLIVDFRGSHRPKLELTTVEAYKAKAQEYGLALCQYFGIIPKIPHTNINLFREFFASPIGLQIVALSLSGGTSKLKAKLNSVLVPKFFSEPAAIPEHFERALEFLTIGSQDLLNNHPRDIQAKFQHLGGLLPTLGNKYPWAVMGLISYFQSNIREGLAIFDHSSPGRGQLNYESPIFIESLLGKKTYPLYPHNHEYFIEFKIQKASDIQLPLTQIKIVANHSQDPDETGEANADQDSHHLELFSGQKHILNIHSYLDSLKFLKYLFQAGQHIPISHILQGTKVPLHQDLKTTLGHYHELESSLVDLQAKSASLIDQIFKTQISLG